MTYPKDHLFAVWGRVKLFRILGPLEIRTGEGWRAIGAPKVRSLLAALLLSRGQVISVARLEEALWEDCAPTGARKLISGYVLRLRRMMDDPEGRVLITRPPGYQLTPDWADVDAIRFEDLVTAGRRALDEHDAGKSAELLTTALALWQGPALADVPHIPLVAAESARLEELRLAALELRIEADLCCGQRAELIPELRRLTAEHPLREQLWTQLMLALDGSGRPADALVAYARARSIIADELGADPSPRLQLLHRSIMRGEPTEARLPVRQPRW